MTQKNDKSAAVETKAVTEPEATPVKPETKTDADAATQQTEQSEQAAKPLKLGRGATGDLSPELIELVTELRDTVKRIDPRKHTEKTLRRVLFNISDILKDIETLYTKG